MDDPKLCKNYLCGFCPCEEFQRTKHDFGTCSLSHSEDAKQQVASLRQIHLEGILPTGCSR